MRYLHGLRLTALILLIVGGLNWGLVGLASFNLVETVLGALPILEHAVYVVVGLAAVAVLALPETWRRSPPSALA